MVEPKRVSLLLFALAAMCVGAIVVAVLVVGPASGSQTRATRTATVAEGVVQSTVSGSGNLQPASQLNLGFKTGGTVTSIYVRQGQQVAEGQLLAELDPQSAEVTLEQAKASLQSAEANLAKEEETNGETSGSTGTGGSTGAAAASASYTGGSDQALAIAASASPASAAPGASTPTTTAGPSTKTPSATSPTTPTTTTTTKSAAPSQGTSSTSTKPTSETGSSSSASVSTATREANLASARAAVKSDTLTAQSDEQAVTNTRLYAPEDGTIVSLSGQVGEVVSGSGTTKASSASSSASGTGGTGTTGSSGASTAGRSASGSTSTSSSSSSSSSSAFAVLSDLSSMQLVAPLSESEIGNVKDGQIATVTVEALEGKKLAAHVREVAILSTSNSGVVSYDVTFQLDQTQAGVKPGMSATAEVVVKQADGINVPTTAISAGTVTVEQNGKQVRRRVVTGLAGNSSTIILSGLKAGETIVLPSITTTTSSGRGSTAGRTGVSGVGGASGAGGLGGAAGGGGGAAFFRGAGG